MVQNTEMVKRSGKLHFAQYFKIGNDYKNNYKDFGRLHFVNAQYSVSQTDLIPIHCSA